MQVELTKEEMNLIQECLTKSVLPFNRDQMIAFANQTGAILQKFQDSIKLKTEGESV